MSTYYRPGTENGFDIDSVPAPGYLKQFLHYEMVVANLAPRTVHGYYVALRTFIRWAAARAGPSSVAEDDIDICDVPFEAVAELTKTDIFAFLTYCSSQRQCGAASRSLKLSALKAFYRYYSLVEGRIAIDPARDIAPPKMEKLLPKYLSYDEAVALLEAVDSDETPRRDYCILTFFVSFGLRLSELTALDLGDVSGDRLRIYGKGRKERVVYLSDACLEAHARYLEERATYPKIQDADALFVSRRLGKRLTPRAVQALVHKYMLKAGICRSGMSPHKLRHTAATLMYSSGAGDLLEIQAILGHSSPQTTAIYTHLEPRALKQVAQAFPELRPGEEKTPQKEYMEDIQKGRKS